MLSRSALLREIERPGPLPYPAHEDSAPLFLSFPSCLSPSPNLSRPATNATEVSVISAANRFTAATKAVYT